MSTIGIHGSIIARRPHGLVVAKRESEGHAIVARQQVREDVLAVGVRGQGLDEVAIGIDDHIHVQLSIQGDGDAGNADLIRILDTVLVRVEPHEVTQRDRLHEREVNLRDVGSSSGQRDRRGRHELALTNLGARCRRAVAVGLLVVGQVHVGAVNLRLTRDNLNLVRAQGQTGKGVLTVGTGLRGDVSAGRVLHRVAVRVEQTDRHTLERLITVIEGPPGIGIVIDGARQGATHLEGRAVLVVVRVGVDLIELTQGRGVRDGRSLSRGLDLHKEVQRLGTTNVEVGVENAGLHRCPGTGRRIIVGGRIDRARARVRRTILADTRLGGHVLHTRRQSVSNIHARGDRRALGLQVHLVQHVVTRHDDLVRLNRLNDTVGVTNRLVTVHLRPGNRLLQFDVGGDVDADLGGLVGQQVGHLAVLHGAAGHGHGVPGDEVGVDRGGHGRDEADLLARLDVAVHHQAEARDRRQVGGSVAPRVRGTTGGGVIHGATRGEDLAAAGVRNRRVLDRDV